MREADIEEMGIRIGGRNLTDLRYADDTALLADNITSKRRILHKVGTAGRKVGLSLNTKKTKEDAFIKVTVVICFMSNHVFHISRYGIQEYTK